MRKRVTYRQAQVRTFAALAAFALILALAGGQDRADAVRSTPTPRRTCFPAAHWAPAPDRYRPCARVLHVEEDGSVTLSVEDADGTVRYTVGVGSLDR